MKGIIFTEFLEMVEQEFGIVTTDAMLMASDLSSGGAYTSVGSYDHQEILRMVRNLSESTGMPQSDLARAFGRYLFHRFTRLYAHFFVGVTNAFELLSLIDSYIHVEVRKLYEDAELPRVIYHTFADGTVQLTYRSARPFADVAEGLIRGCIAHYGEEIRLRRIEDGDHINTHAVFELTRVSYGVADIETKTEDGPVSEIDPVI